MYFLDVCEERYFLVFLAWDWGFEREIDFTTMGKGKRYMGIWELVIVLRFNFNEFFFRGE